MKGGFCNKIIGIYKCNPLGICMFMMCTSMEYKEYKNEIKFERNACFWCNVSTVPNNFYLACSLPDICGQNHEEKTKTL